MVETGGFEREQRMPTPKQKALQCDGYDTNRLNNESGTGKFIEPEGNRYSGEENKSRAGPQQTDHLLSFQLGLGDQLFGKRGWHCVLRNDVPRVRTRPVPVDTTR
jgi:hypothetical protein